MKRRTNATSRNPRPRVVSEAPDLPPDLVETIQIWGRVSVMSRAPGASALLAQIETVLAENFVRIVPTDRRYKGSRVHEVFYLGDFAFTLSVGSA
jgi:hypothetical protein